MRSGPKLALFLLPAFVATLLFLFQRGPRAHAPEALDLIQLSPPSQAQPALPVQLEKPVEPSARKAGASTAPLFPFDLASAQRIRLESSKEFELTEVWLKTALEPRWVERPLLDGMELPYLGSELPLDIRAPGHRDYPVKRASDFALLLVDAYTVLDLSGLGDCLPVAQGWSFRWLEQFDTGVAPRGPLFRVEGNEWHVALSRDPRSLDRRAYLDTSFDVETNCGWNLHFEWKPYPESVSRLDVASEVQFPAIPLTTLRVRLNAPFVFDAERFELKSYRVRGDPNEVKRKEDLDGLQFEIPSWGEIRLDRDRFLRDLIRTADGWILPNAPIGRACTVVARTQTGEAQGRWTGEIEADGIVDISLQPGLCITGQILNGRTGERVQSGEVRFRFSEESGIRLIDMDRPYPGAWRHSTSWRTDSNGRFKASVTSDPPEQANATARPPSEFWATFRAPFFEPRTSHVLAENQEFDVGKISLTPQAPHLVLAGMNPGTSEEYSSVILKREGLPDPKYCHISESRWRNHTLELLIHETNIRITHQVEGDEPSLPIERGILRGSKSSTPFARKENRNRLEAVGVREIEIDLTLPKSLDPEFSATLSYDWKGLLIATAGFQASDTGEPRFLRRTVPDEEIELFITSDDGKLEKRLTVPREQKKVAFAW